MTVTDQLKIIDNKMKANQAQYYLDRLAAKISAYSSGDLRKYEYLTGENLGYKPSVVEQAKFEYSPLGKMFTKGLDKDNQNEGLFKRLKNIEGKIEEILNQIKNQNKKMSTDQKEGFFKRLKNIKGKIEEILNEIKNQNKKMSTEKIVKQIRLKTL